MKGKQRALVQKLRAELVCARKGHKWKVEERKDVLNLRIFGTDYVQTYFRGTCRRCGTTHDDLSDAGPGDEWVMKP